MTHKAQPPLTETQQAILQVIVNIPEGYVASYGYVARQAGLPNGARQVVSTLKKLPADTHIPWHRIINAQRKIAFSEQSDSFYSQKNKLLKEGILFNNNRINKEQMCDYMRSLPKRNDHV
jgi:methylated-DNA-protein-cysteine methyltransferase-like protein